MGGSTAGRSTLISRSDPSGNTFSLSGSLNSELGRELDDFPGVNPLLTRHYSKFYPPGFLTETPRSILYERGDGTEQLYCPVFKILVFTIIVQVFPDCKRSTNLRQSTILGLQTKSDSLICISLLKNLAAMESQVSFLGSGEGSTILRKAQNEKYSLRRMELIGKAESGEVEAHQLLLA
jgi:hypothetical protein